jgi:uncharacterized protein (TIGR02996 family)
MSSGSRPTVLAFLEAAQQEGQPSASLLILADWLEEHGDEARAHFLRLQVQAATLPRYARQRRLLEEQATGIVKQHGDTWLGPLAGVVRGWEFTGGRLEVVMPVSVFLGTAMAGVLGQEAWAWVRQVRLQEVDDAVMTTLAASPRLAQLTRLNLRYNTIGPAGAAALAGSSHLAQLISLDLALNRIGPGGAQALAGPANLENLTYLDLWGNGIGNSGVAALAGSPFLSQLSYLDLDRNNVGSEGAVQLADSPYLVHLTHLNLRNNQIRDGGARALAESPHLVNIAFLSLGRNLLGEPGKTLLRQRFGEAVEL